MSNRRGFTLIETITAITLTAIVVTIAAVALASARDASATIARHRSTLEAESRWRALLADMLRHPPAPDRVSEPLLSIGRDAGGPSLTFLSQGVMQPFGTGRIWRVVVSQSGEGVSLDAYTIGRGTPATPLHAGLPHLHAVDIGVLERGDGGAQWRADWPVERSRPALLRITFASDGASPPPLVVGLAPLDAGSRTGAP